MPLISGRLRVTAVVACAALLLLLTPRGVRPPYASASELAISLPLWAIELNDNALTKQLPEQDANDEKEDDLLAWAHRRRRFYNHGPPPPRTLNPHNDADVFLLIGARTSVVHGFARRQAIRQTWASTRFVPDGVRVVFLGCKPDLSMYADDHQQRLQDAIALERRLYGDLLTNELLECQDSFAGLSDKVRAFFHWAANVSFSKLAFAMTIDDDNYLRLDILVALLRDPSVPSRRFYGGNAACDDCRDLGPAVRDPRDKYYLPRDNYPMEQLPPYLSGQHIILSRDLVHFLARNFQDLRGLGTLDDLTIGLWLFSLLRVQPVYMSHFQGMRHFRSCRDDDLISLGDLSVFATRLMHKNLLQRRRLCEGFELATWIKQPRAIASTTSGQSSAATITWKLQYDTTKNQVRIAVQVFVRAVSVDFVYIPSQASAEEGLCGRAVALLQKKHYLTAGDDLCARLIHTILPALGETTRDNPALAQFVAVAQHNMRRLQIDDEMRAAERPVFTAVLSTRASVVRGLIECLLVEIHPEERVLVWEEKELSNYHRPIDVFVLTALDRFNVCRGARVVILIEGPSPSLIQVAVEDPRVVIFSSKQRSENDLSRSFYIPPISRAFARTIQHTPMMLLHARHDDSASTIERRGLRVLLSCQQTDPNLPTFLHLLQGTIDIDHVTVCASDTGFYLDSGVDMVGGAKFVVVTQTEEDDGSDRVAMAFLAGAIPIYIRLSQDLQLFDPGSFLDCRTSATVEDCAHRVLQVCASSTLNDEMRRTPPITDVHAFEEAFSWYPGIVAERRTREPPTRAARMIERLQSLLG